MNAVGPVGLNVSRRESRFPAVIPVRIYGLDARGKAFSLNVNTVNVSRSGAMLSEVNAELKVGEVIGLQNGPDKAKFRIQWVTHESPQMAGNIGLRCVTAGQNVFGVADPTPPQAAKEVDAARGRNLRPRDIKEKRKSQRHGCDLGVQFRTEGASLTQWARCTDLSMGGCYVETRAAAAVGSRVLVTLYDQPHSVAIPAVVRSSFPMIGMGLEFQVPSVEAQVALAKLVERHVNKKVSRRQLQGVPIAAVEPKSEVAPDPLLTEPTTRLAMPRYPELRLLEDFVTDSVKWANVVDLRGDDRAAFEILAGSVRRQLQKLRDEITERHEQSKHDPNSSS